MSKSHAPTRPEKQSPQLVAAIAGFQSKALKRLVSGMLARNPDEVRISDLKKAIRTAAHRDLFSLGMVLGSSHLAEQKNYIPGKPQSIKSLFWNPSINSEPLSRELELQLGYLASKIDHWEASFSALLDIDQNSIENTPNNANPSILSHINSYGYSLSTIRKSIFIRNRFNDTNNPIVVEAMKQKPDSISFIYFYVCDAIISASNYYIDTAKQWSSLSLQKSENSGRTLIQMLFCPVAANESQLARYLRASGNASALDLGITILANQDAFLSNGWAPHISPAAQEVLNRLISVATKRTTALPPPIAQYKNLSDHDSDTYRLSVAFPEYTSVARWRGAIDYHYGARLFGFHSQSPSIFAPSDSYFPRTLTLKSLSGKGNANGFQLLRYENTQAGTFLRSAATLCALDRREQLWELPQPRLMELLGHTESLSQLLSPTEIKKVHDGAIARNELMVAFLALIMLNEQSPSADLDYELRESFQSLLDEWFQADLIDLLDWLHATAPELTEAVVEVLNIEFLQKLYVVCTTMDEALYQRQRICEWAHEKTGKEVFSIMAKRLAQDRAVGEASKSIDSSRIYVVQSDFNSWCEKYITPYLEQYRQLNIKNTDAEDVVPNPSQSVTSSSSELAFETGPLYYLVSAAFLAHQEFCTNPVYGVNAYLSRRIRHGTLLGFLEKPVWSIIKEYEQHCEAEDRAVDSAIFNFRDRYSEALIELRDEYIQLQTSQTPKGLFSLQPINTPRKRDWFTSFLRLTDQNIQSGTPLREISRTFFEFCWGTVDFDLSRVRTLCAEYRRHITVDMLGRMSRDKKDTSVKAVELENLLREVITEKFSEFEKWFTKPPDVFVTAPFDILCRVVERHAARFTKNHTGKLVLAKSLDFTLSGQGYHDMYDILLALLGNAAKHGKEDADITIDAAIYHLTPAGSSSPTGDAVLEVKVLSTLPSRSRDDKKLLYLFSEEARKNHDASKGATEGKSGIPKVWGTLDRNRNPSEVDIGKRLEASISGDQLTVTIRYVSIISG